MSILAKLEHLWDFIKKRYKHQFNTEYAFMNASIHSLKQCVSSCHGPFTVFVLRISMTQGL